MMIKGRVLIGLLTFLLIGMISCNFAPGSYPYAEDYRLKIKESDLINIIQEFKKDNPEYCVPNEVQLKDGRRGVDDYWYHFYFYYKSDNKILNTWVRQFDNGNTTFAFVAVNKGLNLGNWERINKDFSSKENKLEKAKFEQQILIRIKAMIKY
jgi:hypothetical protein